MFALSSIKCAHSLWRKSYASTRGKMQKLQKTTCKPTVIYWLVVVPKTQTHLSTPRNHDKTHTHWHHIPHQTPFNCGA